MRETPSQIDVHIGRVLRHRRHMLGLTMAQVADPIGLRYQQIAKYETGENRIAASTLYRVCERLQLEPSAVFPQVHRGEG